MSFRINYANIPVLAIGFSRSTDLIAKGIQFFRGILRDKGAPNHAFIVTEDHGQLFATEETLSGLVENSLEKYTNKNNRIVAMYIFKKWNDPVVREQIQQYLAEVRRRAKEDSLYDFKGLFSFVPGFKWFCKPDPKKQWCSENVMSLLKCFGGDFVQRIEVPPDVAIKIIQLHKEEFDAVLGYYI